MRRDLPGMGLVAGQLDVDGSLEPLGGLEHAIDLAECRLGPIEHGRGAVICWKTSNWVSKPLTLWCKSGLRARSDIPGEPESTMTGDFSA